MSGTIALNRLLVIVLAALIALNWGLARDSSERGVEFMPEMARAIPAESYAANAVLANSMTLQQPPAGAIARGWLPLHLTASPADALRASQELSNPFTGDDPAGVERGESIFARYCVLCHGPSGEGDGPVAQRGFPAPPSLLDAHAQAMGDGQLFHIITFGQGNMPGHAAQLDRADRWRAVLRIRQLQAAAGPAPDATVNIAATTDETVSGDQP